MGIIMKRIALGITIILVAVLGIVAIAEVRGTFVWLVPIPCLLYAAGLSILFEK